MPVGLFRFFSKTLRICYYFPRPVVVCGLSGGGLRCGLRWFAVFRPTGIVLVDEGDDVSSWWMRLLSYRTLNAWTSNFFRGA